MTAAQSQSRMLDYGAFAAPPARLLLASDGRNGLMRARQVIGLDEGVVVRSVDLRDKGTLTAPLSPLWVELADEPAVDAIAMLDTVEDYARSSRESCVLSARAEWIDLIAARVLSPSVTILIEPTELERTAALGLALARVPEPSREGSSDRSEERLRQLSEEVNRIALALSRLSDTPISQDTMRPVQAGEGPEVSAELVRSIIRARRLRDQFIPGNLFADPAWDILLDLLQAEIIQHRVPVSSLCIASAVPATTALRWIRTMTDRGMLLRREDPHDARRVFIELGQPTSAALRRYFEKVGVQPVI